MRIKPETFEDLIAILALYRPGPLESGMVDDFIKRKRDPSQIAYDPPQLESILKETYGVIVYQEQVMAIANQLAGFSLGQADLLRRAMGKKKHEEMAKQKELFIAGANNNHIPEKKSAKLFDQIAYFAGYGFNKSHSAAYALVTYQTAYLKAHFPMEFMAALLSNEMGNTDKMVGYFTECRELGLKDLTSRCQSKRQRLFCCGKKGIRFGMAAIKNVGEGAVDIITEARQENGPFTSFFDFCCRMDLQKVNKRVLEGLIKVGAFDSLGDARSQLMAILDKALEEANSVQRQKQAGQTSLFEILDETSDNTGFDQGSFPLPNIPEWPSDQLVKFERELTGFYITAHPLDRHAKGIQRFATSSTATLTDYGDGREVKLCGVVSTIKQLTTKKGDQMAYIQLEDLQGTAEIIVFPQLFAGCAELLNPESLLQVTGTVDQMDSGARVKATAIQSLYDLQEQTIKQVTLTIDETRVEPTSLVQIESIFRRYPGPDISGPALSLAYSPSSSNFGTP